MTVPCMNCSGTGTIMDLEECSDGTSKLVWPPCPVCKCEGNVSAAWHELYVRSGKIISFCAACDHHTYVAVMDDDRSLCPSCYAKHMAESEAKATRTEDEADAAFGRAARLVLKSLRWISVEERLPDVYGVNGDVEDGVMQVDDGLSIGYAHYYPRMGWVGLGNDGPIGDVLRWRPSSNLDESQL